MKGTPAEGHKYGTKSCESASNQRLGSPMLGEVVEPVVSFPETQSQRPKGDRHENAERGRSGGVVDGAGLRADPQHQSDAGTRGQIGGGKGGGCDQGESL